MKTCKYMSRGQVGTALLACALAAPVRSSWAPRPLSDYAAGYPEGAAEGVQRFAHEEAHVLEEGDLELQWEVHVNPATILALDVDHTQGIHILECARNALLLRVPTTHLHRVGQWQHVTATGAHHNCGHIRGRDLYHRIHKVERVTAEVPRAGAGSLVTLSTEELSSANHIFPHCRFSFTYTPVEAMEPDEIAARSERRLFPLFNDVQPKIKNSFTPVDTNTNSMINFNIPKELSNLAWNWDYMANTTENPQFKYTYPGGQGYMRLYKPYLKAHFGISLNFTSNIKTLTKSPDVKVDGELKGFADFNADVATALGFDTDRSASVLDNILDHVHIPSGLLNMTAINAKDKLMSPLKFFMGGTPLTIHPTFTCRMKAYHIGQLKGSLRVGLATKLLLRGHMTFDTHDGLHTDFAAKSLDVRFTPPSWMLYTQHFELGVMLEPDIMFNGLFAGMEDMSMGFSLRPYLNISILEQNGDSPDQAPLVVYPFRLIGLPTGEKYAVEVRANGVAARTLDQISIGMTHFYDSVENFQFGLVAHADLNSTVIEILIIEDGKEVGRSETTCITEMGGECHDAQMMVPVTVRNSTALVQLSGFWKPNAVKSLEDKVKSIGLQFPMITLSGPISEQLKDGKAMDSARLVLKHSGQTFSVPLSKNDLNSTMLLESKMIYELGPVFLDAWKYSGRQNSKDPLRPKVEVTVLGKVVASGRLPIVSWDQENALGGMSGLVGSVGGSFHASVTSIPVTASLYPPGTKFTPGQPPQMLGTAKFNFQMMPVSKAGFIVSPSQAQTLVVGEAYKVRWVVEGAKPEKEQTFYISTKTVAGDGSITEVNWLVTAHVHCSPVSILEINRYMGHETDPCIFEAEVSFPEELQGHLGVIVVNWMDQQVNPYEMITPLIRFSGGRRLDSPDAGQWGGKSLGSTNSNHFGAKVKNKLHKLASHCSSQPLKYGVGAGMNLVEKMHGIMMPGTSMLGDSKPSKADWSSKPVPIFMLGKNQSHKKLSSLLPEALCAGGVCEGMMPGCQRRKVSAETIDKIEFKLTRRFMWKKHVGPKLRHIIAYALALFPTSVQIGDVELQQERLHDAQEHGLEVTSTDTVTWTTLTTKTKTSTTTTLVTTSSATVTTTSTTPSTSTSTQTGTTSTGTTTRTRTQTTSTHTITTPSTTPPKTTSSPALVAREHAEAHLASAVVGSLTLAPGTPGTEATGGLLTARSATMAGEAAPASRSASQSQNAKLLRSAPGTMTEAPGNSSASAPHSASLEGHSPLLLPGANAERDADADAERGRDAGSVSTGLRPHGALGRLSSAPSQPMSTQSGSASSQSHPTLPQTQATETTKATETTTRAATTTLTVTSSSTTTAATTTTTTTQSTSTLTQTTQTTTHTASTTTGESPAGFEWVMPYNLEQSSPRRLDREDAGSWEVETAEGEEEGLWEDTAEFNRFWVHLREPLPYDLTDSLLQRLLDNGAFHGIEDGREETHGPVAVSSCAVLPRARASVDEPALKPAQVHKVRAMSFHPVYRAFIGQEALLLGGRSTASHLPEVRGLTLFLAAFVAVAAFLPAVSVLAAARRHRYHLIQRTDARCPEDVL